MAKGFFNHVCAAQVLRRPPVVLLPRKRYTGPGILTVSHRRVINQLNTRPCRCLKDCVANSLFRSFSPVRFKLPLPVQKLDYRALVVVAGDLNNIPKAVAIKTGKTGYRHFIAFPGSQIFKIERLRIDFICKFKWNKFMISGSWC